MSDSTMDKYYIVPIFKDYEPEDLIGPFKTYEGLLKRVRKIHATQDEDDSIFWLCVGKGRPIMGSFTREELCDNE